MQHITSRQNVRVKEAAKLRDARQRQKQGRFLIDGGREILRAIERGVDVVEAFICEPLLVDGEARQAAERLRQSSPVVATVTAEVFEKLAFGERATGVLAVAKTPATADLRQAKGLGQVALPAAPLIAVIEGVEKPGNVGAILRSADGAGVDAVVIADPRTDLFNPNTIRASLGTVFDPNVCIASTEETLAWLGGLGVKVYAARPEAELLYTDADYRGGAAIVLGSEAEGLSGAWNGSDVTGIRLPMRGIADSLNVSTTAAVLFYEAQRQRTI
ncbi:MAG TPA: RNA methyltransferase [Lacipirellula sp.]